MKPVDLKHYSIPEEMLKHGLGAGVVTFYELKNGRSYFVMGEYHNKGALSPTVGERVNKDQSIYDVIKEAFERKRLGEMQFENAEIDEDNIYYSINAKQNYTRLTFIQNVKIDLSEKEFKEKYIFPMHTEAQHQRSVSEFFWKLDETINPNRKESKFKFKSVEERAAAAKKALDNMKLSHFPVGNEIIKKLIAMQDEKYTWDEQNLPLEFYGKNGGRKYSELTGFYLMSVEDIFQQLKNPKIKMDKNDQEKPTVFIDHKDLPQEEKWKKFFLFEDEIKTIAEVIYHEACEKRNNQTLFKPTCISKQIEDLVSPWKVEKINCSKFALLDMPTQSVINS